MLNIIDYIKKHGDTDYATLPFNDVDRLILSQFSYLKFDGLVPEVGNPGESITISRLSKMEGVDDLFSDERYAKNNRELFESMADHLRFSMIRLNHFINIVDEKWEIQFSAITCILPNGLTYVVYRGTDETIIGWKEDLNMGFMTIPAQEKALDYLNYVAPLIDGDFSLGGHSKGGNLAVYAAMMCSEDIRSRITGVYSHDGPGFSKKVLSGSDFSKIKSKVHKLVPRSSVVGMLLMNMGEYEVVACKNVWILQHDPFNWIVEGCDFVKKDDVTRLISVQNATINKWAEELTDDELKELSDNIYDVFSKADIDNLNDIYSNPVNSIRKLTEAALDLEPEKRKILWNILIALPGCFVDMAEDEFLKFKDQAQDQLSKLLADELDKIGRRSI